MVGDWGKNLGGEDMTAPDALKEETIIQQKG